MGMKITTITIDEHGDSTIDLEGFAGKGCAAIQEGFAKAVGKSVNVTLKSEFHKPVLTTTKISQGH